MTESPATGPAGPSETYPAGLKTHRDDQDRTLEALQRLERATGGPAGHPTRWYEQAVSALAALDEATADEQRNATKPDSLLADILRAHPRLRSRVRGVRAQQSQIREVVSSLRDEVTQSYPDSLDIADLRRRTERLASAIRYQRSRESDLIYEAYYDTFRTEIEFDATGSN